MWQRIQTVFLAVAIIALLVSLVQPIWSIQTETSTHILTPFYLMRDGGYLYFPFSATAILTVAAATLALTSMTKYKKRVVQIKLGALNSLVLVGVVGCSVFFAIRLIEEFQGGAYGLGFYLPMVAVICNLISNFFIRRDERLVRNSERLR
ncbi:MAG TPA: DUF4293 domain-containing protein [Cyclobacteriaceae bacterium]|nr:DUF4293 domain-containing protein [Cyclobacteriaceae bacterium]